MVAIKVKRKFISVKNKYNYLKYYTKGKNYKHKIIIFSCNKEVLSNKIILDLNLCIGEILSYRNNKWYIKTNLNYNLQYLEKILNCLLKKNKVENNQKKKIRQILFLLL